METDLGDKNVADNAVRSDDGAMSVVNEVKQRLKFKRVPGQKETVEGTSSLCGDVQSTTTHADACSSSSSGLGAGQPETDPDFVHHAGLSEKRPARLGQPTRLDEDLQNGRASGSDVGDSAEASGTVDRDRNKPEAVPLKPGTAHRQRGSKEEQEEDYQLNVYFDDSAGKKQAMAERTPDPNWLLNRNTEGCELGMKREPETHHESSSSHLNASQPLPSAASQRLRGGQGSEKRPVGDAGARLPQPFVVVTSAGELSSLVESFANSGSSLPPLLYNMSGGANTVSSSSASLSLLCTLANTPTAASKTPGLTNGTSSVLHNMDSSGLHNLASSSSQPVSRSVDSSGLHNLASSSSQPVSRSMDSSGLHNLASSAQSQAEGKSHWAQTPVNTGGGLSLPQVFLGNPSSLPDLSQLLAERLAPLLLSMTEPGGKMGTTGVGASSSPTPPPRSVSSSAVALSSSVTSAESGTPGSSCSVLQQQTPQTCHDAAASELQTSVAMSAKSASSVTSEGNVVTSTPVSSLSDVSSSSSSVPLTTSVDGVASAQSQNSHDTKASTTSSPAPIVVYNLTPLIVLPQKLFDSIVTPPSPSSSSLAVEDSGDDDETEEEEEEAEMSENEFPCGKCSQAFKTQRELRKHKLDHERKSHKCEECGKSFLGTWQLQKHMRTHNKGRKTFECKVCHETLPARERAKHMKAHAEDKAHVCGVCEKGFNSARHLASHKKSHAKAEHVCDVCSRAFNTGGDLKKHSRTHSSVPFPDIFCEHCGKKFVSAKNQQNHVCKDKKNLQTESQSLTCERCGKKFTSRICLEIHVHSTHMDSAECTDLDKSFYSFYSDQKDSPDNSDKKAGKSGTERFVCPVCGKVLKNFYTLQIHERIHKKPFTCKVCNKSFSHYYQMKRHQHVHTGVKDYTCEVCQKSFISVQTLKLHYTGIHLGDKPFVCEVCGQGFVTRHSLKLHKLKHSDKKPFACDICGSAFKYECVLKSHRLLHLGEKPFKCDICDKAYVCSNYLTKHKRRAHSDPKYTCDVCGKTCYFANELKNHKLIHTDERPFTCEICSKSFHTMIRLKNHKRIHSEEKPFTCNVCDKVFISVGTLNSHNKRVHSGRNFVCEVCKKAFKNYESLKDHMNVHLQLKNFVCDECGKDFYSGNSLNTHKKLKHTDLKKDFVCNVCGKSFPFRSYLREHEKTHSKEKTLVCELCNKAVKYKLSRHMKRVHNYVKPNE